LNIQHRTSNIETKAAKPRVYDLEERLLAFAASVIEVVEELPATRTGNHVAGQLLRCGTSPLPNHGEAQAAESPADFQHKLKVCLKELRETRRWLLLAQRVKSLHPTDLVAPLIGETEELIRIFVASIRTSQSRNARH
jgi:four helix bundle protein